MTPTQVTQEMMQKPRIQVVSRGRNWTMAPRMIIFPVCFGYFASSKYQVDTIGKRSIQRVSGGQGQKSAREELPFQKMHSIWCPFFARYVCLRIRILFLPFFAKTRVDLYITSKIRRSCQKTNDFRIQLNTACLFVPSVFSLCFALTSHKLFYYRRASTK